MRTLNQNLTKATGLSERAGKVYLALLQLGAGTVLDISKKADLKRTTVYNLIPELLSAGLISTEIVKRKKRYLVEDVRSLKNNILEQEHKIDLLIPELQAIHNILPTKPRISYYEGVGGMKELYFDTLKSCEPGDCIYAYTGMSKFYDVFPKDFADYYIKERSKKKIRIQVIAPKTQEAEGWVKTANQTLREIKLIANKDLTFQADMELYANKVALISYSENFMGVIIESKEIYQMMKSMFVIAWEKA